MYILQYTIEWKSLIVVKAAVVTFLIGDFAALLARTEMKDVNLSQEKCKVCKGKLNTKPRVVAERGIPLWQINMKHEVCEKAWIKSMK